MALKEVHLFLVFVFPFDPHACCPWLVPVRRDAMISRRGQLFCRRMPDDLRSDSFLFH